MEALGCAVILILDQLEILRDAASDCMGTPEAIDYVFVFKVLVQIEVSWLLIEEHLLLMNI